MTTPAKSPAAEFRDLVMNKQRDEIARQLPKGIDPDRFIRTVLTVVQMNPELLDCNRTTLMGACMMAAKDGLMPDGKEATIQPYNVKVSKRNEPDRWEKHAQYMPMVGGIIKKMYNTGDVAMLDAAAVYEKDEFIFERGDVPRLVHRPYLGIEDPGPVIAAYVVIKLDNGEFKREVMPRRDIEKVREASKSKNGPGWTNWYDQFAIKAVIKRAAKQLPSSSEDLDRVIEHDNQAMGFDFSQRDAKEITAFEQPKAIPGARPSRLNSIINNATQGLPEQPEPVEVANDQTMEAAE